MFGSGDSEDYHIECDNNAREKIKLKLLDIQNAIDLGDIDCKFSEQNIKCDSISLIEAQNRLDIYINISKLSVYLMNDYEFFSKISIQSAFTCPLYNTAMENLGYQRSVSTWILSGKANQETIIENIFKYCFYSYIVKFKKQLTPEECPRFDNPILPSDEKCNVSDESVVESIILNMCKREQKNNNDIHNNKITKTEDVNFTKEINHDVKVETLKDEDRKYFKNMHTQNIHEKETVIKEIPNSNKMETFQDILLNHKDQWICVACQCLNQFKDVNCQTCKTSCNDNALWICSHCCLINKININICSACNNINEFMKKCNNGLQNKLNANVNISNNKKETKTANWDRICCNSRFQKETDSITRKADTVFIHIDQNSSEEKVVLGKLEPIFDEINIQQNEKGKGIQIETDKKLNSNPWQCNKCTFINTNNGKRCTVCNSVKKIISNENKKEACINLETSKINVSNLNASSNSWSCEKCTFMNENNTNICSTCNSVNSFSNKETKNIIQVNWKCWKSNCQNMNNAQHIYCQTCKLDRTPPDQQTSLVKFYGKNEIREIWICKKCEKYNSKDNVKCQNKSCNALRVYVGSNNTFRNKTTTDHIDENETKMELNSNPWQCNKCTFINTNNGKRCTVCNSIKKIISNENKKVACVNSESWKCWFVNCGQSNDNQFKFCQNCKLSRYGDSSNGKIVEFQFKGVKGIWICNTCFKFNEIDTPLCNDCNKYRFSKS